MNDWQTPVDKSTLPTMTGEYSDPLPGQAMASDVRSIRFRKIMVVDDEPLVLQILLKCLQSAGYRDCVVEQDSRRALERMQQEQPDLVLLDICMPHVSGLEILQTRQATPAMQFTPFIMMTASDDSATRRRALELGASEFLNKPLDPSDLALRVKNALLVKAHQDHLQNYAEELTEQVRRRTAELERSREQIIRCLARAAEFRDNETGKHVVRVGKYAAVIADELGFDAAFCRRIELAAQLHDVGKIGVPDSILLNPGKLDAAAYQEMQRHCHLGSAIIEPLARDELQTLKDEPRGGSLAKGGKQSSLLIMAANICKTHHENWDGTGYPNGLQRNEIPIEGRITAVADVYDALTSHRPYKPAFSTKKSLQLIRDGVAKQFDPAIVTAFLGRVVDIEKIRQQFSD